MSVLLQYIGTADQAVIEGVIFHPSGSPCYVPDRTAKRVLSRPGASDSWRVIDDDVPDPSPAQEVESTSPEQGNSESAGYDPTIVVEDDDGVKDTRSLFPF